MAEFKCYHCSRLMITGDKFTFTKGGPIHLDCFISSRRMRVSESKVEELRLLSSVLESELEHLVLLISKKTENEHLNQLIKSKIKEVEKASGETTRLISDL